MSTPAAANGEVDPYASFTAAIALAARGHPRVTIFAASRGRDLSPYRLNPDEGLANRFLEVAHSFAQGERESVLVPYSAGRTPNGYEVPWVPLGIVPNLQKLLSKLDGYVDIPLFDLSGPAGKQPRLYIVSVECERGWIHFVRSMSSRFRLKRSTKIMAFMSGGVYTSLENDPLLFDEKFDAIVVQDSVFIFNQRNFERSLGFLERAQEAAARTLDKMIGNLRIKNRGDFVAAATSDINMIAKLRSIGEKLESDPAYAGCMTMEKLVPFVKKQAGLGIDIEGEPGREEFVFHSDPQRRWRLLKLLDDDYLHSQITEIDYEANSKSSLG